MDAGKPDVPVAIGVTGIAPDATIGASSFETQSSSAAIRAAADQLGRGDIILLEIHRPGPNAPTPRQGQRGFIAIEWWPDDFAAIRYAVARGIVVVEAAGNGSENFDTAIYDTRPAGFPGGRAGVAAAGGAPRLGGTSSCPAA